MAEFSEVVKHLGRICASNFGECDICDLRLFCPSKTFLDKYAKSGRAERLEEMVMRWASENPGPVYPTWRDALLEYGLLYIKNDNKGGFEIVPNWPQMANQIPADIAERLGVEPKEV